MFPPYTPRAITAISSEPEFNSAIRSLASSFPIEIRPAGNEKLTKIYPGLNRARLSPKTSSLPMAFDPVCARARTLKSDNARRGYWFNFDACTRRLVKLEREIFIPSAHRGNICRRHLREFRSYRVRRWMRRISFRARDAGKNIDISRVRDRCEVGDVIRERARVHACPRATLWPDRRIGRLTFNLPLVVHRGTLSPSLRSHAPSERAHCAPPICSFCLSFSFLHTSDED